MNPLALFSLTRTLLRITKLADGIISVGCDPTELCKRSHSATNKYYLQVATIEPLRKDTVKEGSKRPRWSWNSAAGGHGSQVHSQDNLAEPRRKLTSAFSHNMLEDLEDSNDVQEVAKKLEMLAAFDESSSSRVSQIPSF